MCHISRDGTAIEACEKPAKKVGMPEAQPAQKKKRGRPGKGETREVIPVKLERQQRKTLAQLLRELPRDCDRGSKSNAQNYKNSWNEYKLHLDTADIGITLSALLSGASMQDSLAAIPLFLMTAQRVTNCYDQMDAAYCGSVLRGHSRSLGHVPLNGHNPRCHEKIEF